MAFINGFSVSISPSAIGVRSFRVPGTSVYLPVRAEIAPLLVGAASEWHRYVEPLVPGWNWGWNYRRVTGGYGYSYHSAGIACFSGDTEVVTRTGIRKIGELAGTSAEILTRDPYSGGRGIWREAPVRSFGQQQTHRVTLARHGCTQEIRATAEHQWYVRKPVMVDIEEGGRKRHRLLPRVLVVATDELSPDDVILSCRGRAEVRRSHLGDSHREPADWTVQSVSAGLVEEVFCATVEDTHTFTLAGDILTGNCDLNAPRHPYGRRGTMGPGDADRVRSIARKYGLRWGGDYRSNADEMHLEIILSRTQALERVRQIQRSVQTDNRKVYFRRLVPGVSDSRSVRYLQRELNYRLGGEDIRVDGDYGPATRRKVRRFEEIKNYDNPDGRVGRTLAKTLFQDRPGVNYSIIWG